MFSSTFTFHVPVFLTLEKMDILDTISGRVDKKEIIYKEEILEMAKEIHKKQNYLALEQILAMIGAAYHAGRQSAFTESAEDIKL